MAYIDKVKNKTVYVASGAYSELFWVEDSVTLMGGYNPENWNERDFTLHTTTIVAPDVIFENLIVLAIDSTIDGFTLENNTIDGGEGSTKIIGINLLKDASPEIRGNTIFSSGYQSPYSMISYGIYEDINSSSTETNQSTPFL